MNTNPTPPSSEAGTSDKDKKDARDRRRIEKYLSRGMWGAALAAILLNRPMRKAGGRTLFGINIGFARGMAFIGEELTQLIGVGWTLIEIRWVGLALMNLFLYWKYPVWGPVHVLANFFAFLVLEHFANTWMLQRAITMVAANLGANFVKGLDKSSWGAFWTSIFKALGESGSEVGYETYDLVRKIANEQHYYGLACFICAFGMFGATQMAWVSIPAASLAAYIVWKISTAGGNNKAADGTHVITKVEYDTIKREQSEKGKIVWTVGKGRKFALPWFQSKLQLGMALVIVAMVVGSWTAAYVYRSDTDHDGLSNFQEKVYGADPVKADTDGDDQSDGEEVKKGMNPTLAFDKDPSAVRIANNARWTQTMNTSLRIREDSLRVIKRIRSDSLKAIGVTTRSSAGGGSSGTGIVPDVGRTINHVMARAYYNVGISARVPAVMSVGVIVMFLVLLVFIYQVTKMGAIAFPLLAVVTGILIWLIGSGMWWLPVIIVLLVSALSLHQHRSAAHGH